MRTYVAVYRDLSHAWDAIQDVSKAGANRENITVITGDPRGEHSAYLQDLNQEPLPVTHESTSEKVATGGLLGALTGFLVGVVAVAVPGLGPIIALGPLAAGLTGAGVGAVSGGLLGPLVEAGISESLAQKYETRIREGYVLVIVQTMTYLESDVPEILRRHDAVEIDEETGQWQDSTSESQIEVEEPTRGYTKPPTTREFYVDDFELMEPTFRQHFNNTYGTPAYSYTGYLPAYRYGYQLAVNPDYLDLSWDEVRARASSEWNPETSTWNDVEDAVQYAWDQVRVAMEDARGEYGGLGYKERRNRFYNHYNEHYAASGVPYDKYDKAYYFGRLLEKTCVTRTATGMTSSGPLKNDGNTIIPMKEAGETSKRRFVTPGMRPANQLTQLRESSSSLEKPPILY